MNSKRFNKISNPVISFLKNESASGIILMICAAIALIIANSGMASSYDNLLQTHITIGYKNFSLSMSLIHWINDGLMAIFFFVVGMEIKRELVVGDLKSISKTILPVGAAIGGIIIPALIYTAFNYNQSTSLGWGIPMATDIAFSLGVLSSIGRKRVPKGIFTFLTALAIVDDLGAIIVIAIFYTSEVSWTALLLSLIVIIVLILMNKFKVKYISIFIILGIALWVTLLKSGIHSTIAGVILAMTIPVKSDKSNKNKPKSTMLYKIEAILEPWSSFVIIPIFALANAGVAIKFSSLSKILVEPVGLGVFLGLLFGKQIGIFGASFLLIHFKIAKLPSKVTLKHIYAAGLLGGIGFTMSLFISSLSFPGGEMLAMAKISILGASILSAIAGVLVFRSIKVYD